MGKIILARHGESDGNAKHILNGRLDTDLTAKGERQAEELAEALLQSEYHFSHIFCSPLKRARKTADICGKILSLPVTVLDCLVERNHGILEGRPYTDIPLLAKEYISINGSTYIIEAEGAENYEALCMRAGKVLDTLEQEILHRNIIVHTDVLVVCHGALMRAMCNVSAGHHWESMKTAVAVDNCAIRVLERMRV